jgi:hypothetical protein
LGFTIRNGEMGYEVDLFSIKAREKNRQKIWVVAI